MLKKILTQILILLFFTPLPRPLSAQPPCASHPLTYISDKAGDGNFALVHMGIPAPLCISSRDYPGVIRVAKHLQNDIQRVTDLMPDLISDEMPETGEIVLIGTLGRSRYIDQLVQEQKLDITAIAGKRESFLIQSIEKPFPGVSHALIITGSDKRGTIYGMFDLAEKIGVSPWYWWADVPVKKKTSVFVLPGWFTSGEPKVTYRGIFINDEAPALSGWAFEKFGGFNAKFYAHVFELILRLKGNFLWPAMWGRAFYVDDPENPRLADEYGIVIGTSHHEPMMRAHAEWARFGSGPWNYETNEAVLRDFWTEGIRRMDNYESIVTLAMRGDGDEPMTEEANIALLQKIVADQREILGKVTGNDITTIPQVWALYKEVQEYYDKGMRVPDDVTLLLCDDNWGNIRKLPRLDEPPRAGGYGIYYHYDYVGGPRNYKWLNTNQISRVWEQMHLAYAYGATRIWIVNVGDIKPMEFPIEFFLDFAWDPEKIPAECLPDYTRRWAEEQFGPDHSDGIAEILSQYTRFNARRKPELLSHDTYSLTNYREAETVVGEYKQLEEKAKKIAAALPAEYRDAFYQLILHPVEACANLNELYYTVGKNRQYAEQGRVLTNSLAEKAGLLFEKDDEISRTYNKELAGGKWNHMMDQTHIGYTYWQQPDENVMPEVTEIDLPSGAGLGVAIEGSDGWWSGDNAKESLLKPVLPEFDKFNRQTYYIEIFNRGTAPFEYLAKPAKPCVKIDQESGTVETEKRLWISIDWERTLPGKHMIPVTISGPGRSQVVIYAVINNRSISEADLKNCFIESNGTISIEAEHFTKAVGSPIATWQKIPGLGRTLSGMTVFPATVQPQTPGNDNTRLEYRIYLYNAGELQVNVHLSPTLNFHNNQGLRFGISFDDKPPQIINMHRNRTFLDWEESVRNNISIAASTHVVDEPGLYTLKFWAVDPGVVLQRIIVETRDVKPSYLGPPESFFLE